MTDFLSTGTLPDHYEQLAKTVRDFARTVLGEAIDYDRAHASQLLRTARVLLDRDLDRRAAADVLHLHPNTVRYRVERWHQLTGWDVRTRQGLIRSIAALGLARR